MSRRSGERFLELELNEPLTWYDYAVEWVLGIALVVSPFWYGATSAAGQQVLFALVAILAVLMGAKLSLVRGSRFVFSWAYLPMLLYLLVICLSVIPLPAGVVRIISPGTVEEKARLMADIPNASALLSKLTISFNVWSTQRGLRLVLAASVVFVTVANTYQTPAQVKRLLATITSAGILITLLTLAQNITHDPGQPYRIYWNIPEISVDAWHPNAGPFPGKAQLGQYLNLTVGAMAALLLVRLGEALRGEDSTGRELIERMSGSTIQIAVVQLIGISVTLITLAWSFSRGAILGAGVAGAVVFCLILIKRGWRKGETGKVICALLLIAVALIWAYLLLEPSFQTHASSTADSGSSRFMILKSMVPMFHRWPVLGTGLETFEWIFPLVQPKGEHGFFVYAENDWAQMFTDTGVVGGVLVLSFVAIMVRTWIGAFRGRQPIHMASLGIAMSIIAIMVHSVTDFSQHAPAVATVTAVLLGLTVSLNRLASQAALRTEQAPRFGWTPWPRLVGGIAVIAAMAWSVWSLDYIRRAEILFYESDPASSSFNTAASAPDFDAKLDEYYDPVIQDDAEAVRLDPNNVLYVHSLNHFRWRKLSARRDAVTTAIIYPPNAKQVAETIATELSAARAICPCYGKLYTLLGKMQWELLDRSQAVANLEIGRTRRPTDAEPMFYLAEIAAAEGRWDDVQQLGAACLDADFHFKELLINCIGRQYGRWDVAFEASKDNSYALPILARELSNQPKEKVLQTKVGLVLLDRAKKEVDQFPKDAGRWWGYGDCILDTDGPRNQVVDAYRRALELDYGNTSGRIKLARLLQTIGRRDEAEKEAEICLRINPQLDEAKVLLASLKELPPPTPRP